MGGRLAATQALFGILGGVGVIDPTGAWTCVPDNWGPTVATLDVGPNGTVLDVPYSIDTDGVANTSTTITVVSATTANTAVIGIIVTHN